MPGGSAASSARSAGRLIASPTPSGQHGSPLSPLRIGTGGKPNSASAIRAQYRTVMNSLRRLATERSISGSSSAIGDNPGGSEYSSAQAKSAMSGSTADIKVLSVIAVTAGAVGRGTAQPAPSSP